MKENHVIATVAGCNKKNKKQKKTYKEKFFYIISMLLLR